MTSERCIYIKAVLDPGVTLRDATLALGGGEICTLFKRIGPAQIVAVGDLETVKRQWIREHLHAQLDALNALPVKGE